MTTAWQVVTVCHSTELERLQGRSVPGYLIYKENKRVLHTVLTADCHGRLGLSNTRVERHGKKVAGGDVVRNLIT